MSCSLYLEENSLSYFMKYERSDYLGMNDQLTYLMISLDLNNQ